MPTSRAARDIATLEIQRPLDWRKIGETLVIKPITSVTQNHAAIIQSRGEVSKTPCRVCQNHASPFATCVTAGKGDSEIAFRACGNCLWRDATQCNLRSDRILAHAPPDPETDSDITLISVSSAEQNTEQSESIAHRVAGSSRRSARLRTHRKSISHRANYPTIWVSPIRRRGPNRSSRRLNLRESSSDFQTPSLSTEEGIETPEIDMNAAQNFQENVDDATSNTPSCARLQLDDLQAEGRRLDHMNIAPREFCDVGNIVTNPQAVDAYSLPGEHDTNKTAREVRDTANTHTNPESAIALPREQNTERPSISHEIREPISTTDVFSENTRQARSLQLGRYMKMLSEEKGDYGAQSLAELELEDALRTVRRNKTVIKRKGTRFEGWEEYSEN